MYIAVLGAHPELSMAELERVQSRVARHTDHTARFEKEPAAHLGGSSKLARVIEELPTTHVPDIRSHILNHLDTYLPDKSAKLSLGVSIYGQQWQGYKSFTLEAKKQLKQLGYRPRIVLGRTQELSPAQVFHNRLDYSQSELIVSIGEHSTLVATTVWVQDIDAYRHRDMDRPCRDMQTGMLPPKLAQIMLNLAGGEHIYDPFCGSGVILQEALLMGKHASGSDLEPAMVECARRNLEWLGQHFDTPPPQSLEAADARKATPPDAADAIVSESYLGPIFTKQPTSSRARELAAEAEELLRATLDNFRPQLPAGTPVCMAVPAWHTGDGIVLPPLVDDLSSLGYNHIRLAGVSASDMRYRRSGQYVGRQLILVEKV